jgi:hypothetical protein
MTGTKEKAHDKVTAASAAEGTSSEARRRAAEGAASYHVNKALSAYRTGTRLERDREWDKASPYFDTYSKHIALADKARRYADTIGG